jgi:hypothetical protein
MRNFKGTLIGVCTWICAYFLLLPSTVFGQCPGNTAAGANCSRSASQHASILIPNAGCGVWKAEANYGPGRYFRMPVLNGGCYSISTCGAPFDTQLSLFQGSTATTGPFAYNDDNGPHCTGNNASVNFTPSFTDYVAVDVRQYNCLPGGSSSITVNIRQNNNLSITSVNTNMCQGQTRALTAVPARVTVTPQANSGDVGTFTGSGVSGTTFTAPTPGGGSAVNTVTYTFGYCTTTQNITVFRTPAAASAGSDIITCTSTATLAATAPAYGTGAWTIVSGPGAITAPTSNTSAVTGLVVGSPTTFRWTVSNGPCTTTSDDVVVTQQALPAAPTSVVASPAAICNTLSSSLSAISAGNTIAWYTVASGGASFVTTASGASTSVSPGATTTYYAEAVTPNGCRSASRTAVTLTVNPLPAAPSPVTANPSSICSGFSSNLVGTSVNNTIRWYTVASGGASIGNSASGANFSVAPTATQIYYADALTPQGCISATRNPVTVTVKALPTPTFSSPFVATVCQGDDNIVYTTEPSQSNYQWTISGGIITSGGGTGNNTATVTWTTAGTGSISVNYTNSNGCTAVSPTTRAVTVHPKPGNPITSTPYSGCGVANVTANVGTNGTTCRFYGPNSLNTFISSGTSIVVSLLGTNTYYISSYNATTGCEGNRVPVSVTVGPTFSLSIVGSNYNGSGVSCPGGTNGTATATSNATDYPIEYAWSNGTTNIVNSPVTSNTISGLAAGTYVVTVTSAGGCVNVANVTLSSPTATSVTLTNSSYSGFGVSCNGGSNGTVNTAVTGGAAPYSYIWSSAPGGFTSTLANVSGLTARTYNVTVSDANGCTTTASTALSQPAAITFSSSTGYVCSGSNYISATVTINPTGGASGNYEYQRNGGAWQTSNTFAGLANGSTHSFAVRDLTYPTCVSAPTNVTITFPPNGVSVDDCNFIYASPNGDPNGTLGSKNCPVTLAQAFVIYGGNPARNHVLMQAGNYTYNQKIVIPAGVTVEGGYTVSGTDWIKGTNSNTVITINPALETSVVAGVTVGYYIGLQPAGNNFTLKDLTVNVLPSGAVGTTSSRGRSVYGMYVSGQTGFVLSRCVITTGAGSAGANGAAVPGTGGAGGFGNAGGGGTSGGGCSSSGGPGTAGTAGNGGATGGFGGAPCSSSGCNIFGCNSNGCTASPGGNGATGAGGTSFAPGNQPSTAPGLLAFYLPVSGSNGGNGFGGGGGGGGGGGAYGTCCTCSCGPYTARGGNGGTGGSGGLAGNGGFGGGASIAIYANGGSGIVTDAQLTPGSGGVGGAGTPGQPGNPGSPGFLGSDNSGWCDGGKGGKGGDGGTGGSGGRGQDGATGLSQDIVNTNGATVTQSGTTVPNDGSVTANWARGCRLSQINITKTSGSSWTGIGTDPDFVDDLTATSTSYGTGSNNANIYFPSTSALGDKNLSLGSTTLTRFVRLYGDRLVVPSSGIINPIATPCPNGSIVLGTNLSAPQLANIVGWEWEITALGTPTVNVYASTAASPGTVPAPIGGWQAGQTYQVRLQMRELCCGWSIPVYRTFTVAPTLAAPSPITAGQSGTVCAGAMGLTYSVPAVSGATAYTWAVNGGSITSGQGTTSITVSWGAALNGATVSVFASNACAPATNSPITTYILDVNGLPSINIVAQGNAPTTFCQGGSVTLQANTSSGGGDGNGSFTWNWTPGNTGGSTLLVNPANPGTYPYTVTATEGGSGCVGTASQSVTVIAPVPQTITGVSSLCFGATATFTATTPGGTWSTNNPSVATVNASSGLVTGVSAGSATVTYSVVTAGNCVNSATFAVTVLPAFNPGAISGGANATVCLNFDPSVLSANATGGAGTYSYQWQASPAGCNSWANINGANGATFDPPAVSATICYRVLVDATGAPDCGNALPSANTITFTLESTAPTIACVANQTRNTNVGTCSYAAAGSEFQPAAFADNCPGAAITYALSGATTGTGNNLAGVVLGLGTTTVTWTVTDVVGLSATCAFTVTVVDAQAPNAICQPVTVQLDNSGNGTLTAAQVNNGSNDACGILNLHIGQAGFTCANVGANTVVLTVTDVNNNTSTCSATVTVVDNINPTITCPANISVNNALNACSAPVTFTVTTTDNCSATVLSSPASGSTFAVGTTTVNSVATDGSGNTATCSFTVTVVDNQLPTITCPANVTVNNDPGLCSAIVTYATPAGSDNCPGQTTALTAGLNSNASFPVGSTTNTFVVTAANGQTASCSFSVTVLDNESPTIACPVNITVNTTPNQCNASVTVPQPAAADNCGGLGNALALLDIEQVNVGAVLPSGSSYTKEAWVKMAATQCENIFSSNQDPFWFTGGRLSAGNGNNYSVVTDPVLFPINTWAHVAVTYDAGTSTMRLYKNGVQVSVSNSSTPYSGGAIAIGQHFAGGCNFSGTVDEVRMWNVARSPVQISAMMNSQASGSETGLVALYGCNQGIAGGNNTSIPNLIDGAPAGGNSNGTFVNVARTGTNSNFVSGAPALAGTTISNDFNSSTNASGTYPIGTTPVVWTATDASGNTASCAHTVTVVDNQPPVISCPTNMTVNTDLNNCSAIVSYSVSASDNCPGQVFAQSGGLQSGGVFPLGTTANSFIATDASGNTATCTFTVTVVDLQAPNAICQPVTVQLDNSGNGTLTAAQVNNGSNDACGILNLHIGQAGFTCANVGANTVVLTVTDVNNNTSTCASTVTVQDNVAPNAICQPVTVQLDNSGNGTLTAAQVNNGSNDACGILNLHIGQAGFTCANVGANTVVLTVTDVNNNTSTCSATVTVQDLVAPNAICQPVTVQLDNSGNGTLTAAQVNNGSNDACGILNLHIGQAGFTCANVGANTVVLTVTDVNNNTSTCSATVTVQDLVAPNAICQPVTVQLDNSGNGTLTAAQVNNGSNDACGILNLHIGQAGFTCANVGANTVVLTVTDVNNNTSTCSATVTVQDLVAPNAICQPVTVQLDNSGNGTLTAAQVNNGSNDACGILNLHIGQAGFTCANVGANTVVLTVTDVNNNTSTCSATVTVQDLVAPNAICQPVTVQLDNSGNGTLTAAQVNNGSNDACGILSLHIGQAGFTCANVGANTVVLTVTDVNNNTSTCSATVTVQDLVAPNAICQPVTVQLDNSGNGTLTAAQVNNGSNDACGIASTTLNNTTFNCSNVSLSGNASDLIISEYVEGSGNEKYIELFNGTGASVNLSNYRLRLYSNGAGAPTNDVLLSGTLANGASIVYRNSAATLNPSAIVNPAVNFNGDDAVALFKVSPAGNVDIFGRIGEDPGTAWLGGGNSTLDKTLRRNSNVTSGISVNPGAGFPTLGSQWTQLNTNDVSGLGAHSLSASNSVTLMVTDVNGNSSTCTATVNVQDNVAPVAVCQNLTVNLNAAGNGSITAAQVNNGSNDACGIGSLTLNNGSFGCANVGANTVVLTVTDVNGNSSTCSSVITVQDLIAPVALCQNVTVQLDNTGNGSTNAAAVNNGSSDACGIATTTLSPTAFTCANVNGTPASSLFISEYIEGSSNNKCIEIFNGTGAAVNLSGYSLRFYFNGSTSATTIINLSGSVANGDVYVVCDDNATAPFTAQADLLSTSNFYNGNDAIELRNGATAIDIIGSIGENPTAWTGGGLSTLDRTLVRNSGISSGNTSNALGFPSLASEWTGFAVDNSANLGSHAFSGGNNVVLTVTDVNGNSSTCSASVTVEDNVAPVANCQNVTINLASSGSQTVAASSIDNGSSDACGIATTTLNPNSFTCDDLGVNNVTLTVTDVNGNSSTCAATVTVTNDPLVATTSSPTFACGYNVSCNGATNGSASVSTTGGCLGYTYLWSNGQTTATATGLGAGTHSVTVTDLNGTTTTASVTLTEPALLTSVATSPTYQGGWNVSCNGATDGSIDLTVGGGASCLAYTFNWSNGATTEDLSNIGAGTYSVTATDANGCTTTATITLTEPAQLATTLIPQVYQGGWNISCNGASDGMIFANVSRWHTSFQLCLEQWCDLTIGLRLACWNL